MSIEIVEYDGRRYAEIVWAVTTAVLPDEGTLVNSESLGHEGHDHLQFFDSVEDMDRLFRKLFKYRAHKVVAFKTYNISVGYDLLRQEGFCHCCNRIDRIQSVECGAYGEPFA